MTANKQRNKGTLILCQAALIAAITFVSFLIGIPIPGSLTGTKIYFGNAFVVIGALLIGGPWGGLSGAVGLTLADLLNGYVTSAPKTFVLKLIIGLVAGLVSQNFMHIREKGPEVQRRIALVSSLVSLGLNAVLDPIAGYFYKTYLLGIPQVPAEALAKISSVASVANAAICILIVTIFWPLLQRGMKKGNLLSW